MEGIEIGFIISMIVLVGVLFETILDLTNYPPQTDWIHTFSSSDKGKKLSSWWIRIAGISD